MDYEQYSNLIANINTQLQTIAELTVNQAHFGCADSTNPAFVRAMAEHKRLTELAAMLNTQQARQIEFRGEVVQVGDDERGQPRILIHGTRADIVAGAELIGHGIVNFYATERASVSS